MFGSFIFGQGYFAQGPPGVATLPPPNPAQADVIVMVREDVGQIRVRPDDGTIEVRADVELVEIP